MPVNEDLSAPLPVVASGTAGARATTAPFSPPACLLLARVTVRYRGSVVPAVTVTDSAGHGWTLVTYSGPAGGCYSAIWEASAATAPGSLTVSATDAAGHRCTVALDVLALTGCTASQAGAATAADASSGNAPAAAVTPTARFSWVLGCAVAAQLCSSASPWSDGTVTEDFYPDAAYGSTHLRGRWRTQAGEALEAWELGWTVPCYADWCWCACEVLCSDQLKSASDAGSGGESTTGLGPVSAGSFGFEDGIDGWLYYTPGGTCALSRSSAWAAEGSYSLLSALTAAATEWFTYAPYITVAPGQYLELAATVMAPQALRALLNADWKNAAGSYLAGSASAAVSLRPGVPVTLAALLGPAPALTAETSAGVDVTTGGSAGESLYIDNVSYAVLAPVSGPTALVGDADGGSGRESAAGSGTGATVFSADADAGAGGEGTASVPVAWQDRGDADFAAGAGASFAPPVVLVPRTGDYGTSRGSAAVPLMTPNPAWWAGLLLQEGFSLDRAALLDGATGAEDAQLYGAQQVSVAPQVSLSDMAADDVEWGTWNQVDRAVITVTGGFLPFATLAALTGYRVASSGASPEDYYALALWPEYGANRPAVPLALRASGRDADGHPRTLTFVLYKVRLAVVDFTGTSYKTGLGASYAGTVLFSSTDERGNALAAPEIGRLVSGPGGGPGGGTGALEGIAFAGV